MDLNRLQKLAGIPLTESASTVQELNGFKRGDRVCITDVDAKPPQTYTGEIKNLFDDAYAHITYDTALTPQAKHNLEDNGRVPLVKCKKITKESVVTKQKQIVTEGTVSEKVEIHSSGPSMGQSGDIIVIEGNKTMAAMAKLLGVPDGWKKVQIKNGVWAAYDGARLTFFNRESDFQSEDSEEDDN